MIKRMTPSQRADVLLAQWAQSGESYSVLKDGVEQAILDALAEERESLRTILHRELNDGAGELAESILKERNLDIR